MSDQEDMIIHFSKAVQSFNEMFLLQLEFLQILQWHVCHFMDPKDDTVIISLLKTLIYRR